MEAGGLGILPQEQRAGGGGRRGCERLQGHHRTLETWLGHCPSVLGSWHSFFHVQQISQSSYHLCRREEHTWLIIHSINYCLVKQQLNIFFMTLHLCHRQIRNKSSPNVLSTRCTLQIILNMLILANKMTWFSKINVQFNFV